MGEDTDIIDIIIRTGGIALIVLFSWVSIVVIAVFFGLKRKDKDETIQERKATISYLQKK